MLDLTSLSLTDLLALTGTAYAGLSLAATILPKSWRLTKVCARLSADLRGVVIAPPSATPLAKTEAAKDDKPRGVPNALLLLAIGASAFACSPGRSGKVNWPAVVDCAPEPESIIGAVSEVLLDGGSWKQALEDLARVHGTTTVTCAVERLRSDWAAPGAAASPERVDGLVRANEFMDGKQTN